MARLEVLPTTKFDDIERTIIRRHGLSWNLYVTPRGKPTLYWPNGSVSHPNDSATALAQVKDVDPHWFDQQAYRGEWFIKQRIRNHCDCDGESNPHIST